MEKHVNAKKALGKGFNSLLGLDGDAGPQLSPRNLDKNKVSPEEGQPGRILELEIARISPNPNQPRKIFDQVAIESLAKSIEVDGIIQPIIVRPGKKHIFMKSLRENADGGLLKRLASRKYLLLSVNLRLRLLLELL